LKIVNVQSEIPFTEVSTPLQALLLADIHCKAIGFPHLSPLEFIRNLKEQEEVQALFAPVRLTMKDLLPGVKLKAGSSQITIIRVRPYEKEITYKNIQGIITKMDSVRFLNLLNQQSYRKVWDIASFLTHLKDILKPVLPAIPMMWVLKLVLNIIRKKPVKYAPLYKEHL